MRVLRLSSTGLGKFVFLSVDKCRLGMAVELSVWLNYILVGICELYRVHVSHLVCSSSSQECYILPDC